MGCFRSQKSSSTSQLMVPLCSSKPHSAWYSSEDSISTGEEITLKPQVSFKKNKMTQHKMCMYICIFPLLLTKKCSDISLKGSEERGTWKYLAFTNIIFTYLTAPTSRFMAFEFMQRWSVVIRNSDTDMLNFLFKFSCCSPENLILQ